MPDRERAPATSWHPWLLVLLWLVLGPRAVDAAVGASVAATFAGTMMYGYVAYITGAAQILGLLAAGIAVDRYGIRAVVAISLAIWAALIAADAALATSPAVLYLAHVGSVFAGCFFGVGVPVAAKLAFGLSRRALVLATINILALAWLLLLPLGFAGMHWPPKPLSQPGWATGCLVAAGFAGVLTVLWALTFRRRDGRASRAVAPDDPPPRGASFADMIALLRRRGIWALVVVMTCHMQVFVMLFYVLAPYMVRERLLPAHSVVAAVLPPFVVSVAAQIAFAVWSDGRARKTGQAAKARVPFIVGGAAASATIGLLPFADRGSFGLIYWALAFGMAAFPLSFTFGFDIVPRSYAGRFFGLTAAFSVAVNAALFVTAGIIATRSHSYASYFDLAGIASIVGAVAAFAKLRNLEPIEDPDATRKIGEVFA